MADPLAIVATTAEAAVGTDEEGRVVIWNRAAERLLGRSPAEVLGRPCHDVVGGRDVFGNRFCDEHCALRSMLGRQEAVSRFEMDVRTESGESRRVSVSVVAVPGPRPSQHTLIHILQPVTVGEAAPDVAPPAVAVDESRSPPDSPDEPPALTPREVEVLRLLARGTATQSVADGLFISVTTVRNHVQNILRKLEAHSKLEAVAIALRRRLI